MASKIIAADQVRSLFAPVTNPKPGALVHTLSVTMDRGVDAAAFAQRTARIAASLRSRLSEELWDARSAVFFRERIAHAPDSAEAAALCRRELTRLPAASTEHQLRIACFEFADGSARLIARAHRALISRHLLRRIVLHIACGEDIGIVEREAEAGDVGPPDLRCFTDVLPVARWTSPGGAPGSALTERTLVRASRNHFVPALWRVLAAFNQGQNFSLPVLIDGGGHARLPASGAGWRLLALDQQPDACADVAALQWQALESCAPVWLTAERIEALRELWGSEPAFLMAAAIGETVPFEHPALHDIDHSAFQLPPFPVTVLCEERPAGTLAISIQYDCGAISRHSAESLQACVVNVMAGMTVAPRIALAQLPLLTQIERQATLKLGRSRGPERLLSAARLEQRVAALARANPAAIAVSDECCVVSYGELEQRSNRIARYLASRGVGHGDRVGLCLARSAHMPVVALAVLKAGALYVPIDPEYPADRIAYVGEDANLKLQILQAGSLVARPGQETVALTELLRHAEAFTDAALCTAALSIDEPAYMIYTSGSTGRPKGVQVSHRNVQALLGAVERDLALDSSDVWSLFHSFSFDFSVWEMWGALLTGGHVHVVSYEVSRNTDEFVELIGQRRITILSQTPSAFSQLMAADRSKPIGTHLRLVIFGGEALDARLLLPWFDRHPETHCRLINMFGITETTVHVTATEIRRIHALTGSRSVGRPIDGWGVYVLAPDGSVVPPGVDGEIYVSGSGVSLGYHNRPELDRQRFLPDLQGQGRMYRSGDRGRLLPNGELLHLGRLDHQVKLRGFRIELDEIRNVLLCCRGVAAAAALFTQSDPADAASARIDAYVVMNDGALHEVWSQAVQLLPDYMLPTSIARVSSMPLTSNGKLDPRKLAGNILEKCGRPAQHAEPEGTLTSDSRGAGSSDMQRHLIEIWTEVFDKPIQPQDNFFDVGGNSLFAIRLSSKLRQRGLPALNLRDLYVHQTIARLAPVLAGPVRPQQADLDLERA